MQSKSCPISLLRVDTNVARISAFYVGLFLLLFLITHTLFIPLFLVGDFAIRLFGKKEFSPIYFLALFTKKQLKLSTKMVDAAPKRLAMLFGLVFVIAITFASLFHAVVVTYILSIVLFACIVLEVAFSYCLGCEIYHLYKKVFV